MYESGEGGDVDLARATKLYQLSCDEGVQEGCENLQQLADAKAAE